MRAGNPAKRRRTRRSVQRGYPRSAPTAARSRSDKPRQASTAFRQHHAMSGENRRDDSCIGWRTHATARRPSMASFPHRIDRRDFVRTASAGLALAPFLDASALAQMVAPRRSRVALVRTADRKRGVAEALRLLDIRPVAGKRVVLKPNFNSADD